MLNPLGPASQRLAGWPRARQELYPPSPRRVPADLTAPSGQYQVQAILVLVSLLVFFGLYFLAALALLALIPLSIAFIRPPFSLLFAGPAVVALLFLLKGFFKKEPAQ